MGLVAFLLVLAADRIVSPHGGTAIAVQAGKTPAAPRLVLTRLQEPGDLDLAAFRGRVVVLEFWASWCDACKDEARQLERLAAGWADRGVSVVGVAVQDAKSDARRFAADLHLTYPLGYDGSNDSVDAFGVTALPTTFVVARRGNVARVFIGVPPGDELKRILRSLVRAG